MPQKNHRMARYRERQRRGTIVVSVPVDEDAIEALIDAEFLRAECADCREAVREALTKLVANLRPADLVTRNRTGFGNRL